MPVNATDRQIWSIWIRYPPSVGGGRLVPWLLVRAGVLAGGPGATPNWAPLLGYPTSALLAAPAYFAMGSSFWGRCYAIGPAFLGLAVVLPLQLELAPLLFGLLWGAALVGLGRHPRRLAAGSAEAGPAPPSVG